jgi:TATA-box binding protein (TBP) (component of TFIID and TFIIIB)
LCSDNQIVLIFELLSQSMPQVQLYLNRTRAVVSISANGHVGIVGAKSVQDAKRGLMVCARICQRLEFEVRPRDFKVLNMMAIARAGFRVDLNRLAAAHRDECRYDPQIVDGSPSLVYQMPMPASLGSPVQLAIWSTGTIRFQKCQSDEAMQRALSAIMTVLSDFREQ